MKTNKDYQNEAINQHIGNVKVGDIVACHAHKLTHTLIDIVGSIGVCQLPDGTINHFSIMELFDINAVSTTALNKKILNGLRVDRNN